MAEQMELRVDREQAHELANALLAQALTAERQGRDYDRRMPDRDRLYWRRRARALRAYSAEIIGAWRAQGAPPA
jgi:hypothetical protein